MKSEQKFALLRIAFGCVWAVDAFLKWQPAFLNGLVNNMTMMLSGQPGWVAAWISLWITIVTPHAHAFALAVAIIETALAVSLIFGLFTRVALAGGAVFSLLLWSVAEGFGGPYAPGSTDIGAAVMYAFVCIALLIGLSWREYSIDALLQKKWPRFFLWRDSGNNQKGNEKTSRATNGLISFLIFCIIVLGSILCITYFPSPSSVGAGAMAPMGMMTKTYALAPTDPVPTVDFTITRDPVAMGGWDVHITTTNFIFTPQNVNQSAVPNQGHVHLYVDNTLYVVYGSWYHLDNLSPGAHVISVALAANDHSLFTENDAYIQKQKTIVQ